MAELDPFSFVAVITDADGTFIDNRENVDGIGLHNLSRFQAAVAVGQRRNLHALAALPVDVHVSAHAASESHTSNSAFWWTLMQAGILSETDRYHPGHPAMEIVEELVNTKDEIYTARIATDTLPVPGSLEFFAGLYAMGFDGSHGTLGIGSNAKRGDIEIFLDAKGFGGLFPPEHITGKEDIQNPKPEPETFMVTAENMGVPVSEFGRVAVFGDDPRDTEAAKRSGKGMIMHAVTTLLQASVLQADELAYRPDFVARDFNEYGSRFGILT